MYNLNQKHMIHPLWDLLYLWKVLPNTLRHHVNLFQLGHYIARNKEPLKLPQEKGYFRSGIGKLLRTRTQGLDALLIGCRVSLHIGALPSVHTSVSKWFFFIHNFGRYVTSICHGFSSLKWYPFILASASVAKHILGFLHSNSQDRESVDATYSLCQDVCHVQTMERPPWGGGLTYTPTSNGHRNQTGNKTLGPWAFPMSSA